MLRDVLDTVLGLLNIVDCLLSDSNNLGNFLLVHLGIKQVGGASSFVTL